MSDSDGGPDDDAPDRDPGATGREAATPARRRLSLTSPLAGAAAEDRPESWGDSPDSDSDRLEHYVAQRPPHHGA